MSGVRCKGGLRPVVCVRDRLQCAGPRPVREQGGGRGAVGAQASLALAARGCPAMLGLQVAPRNSLHSLRSLRSNTRGESDHEARGYARRPQPCASRRRHSPRLRPARRLAGSSRSWVRSEGQAAGIEPVACRAPQARVQAPAGLDARLGSFSNQEQVLPRKAVGGCAVARLCGGEEASPDTNSPVDCSCLASGWALAPGAACKARAEVGARTRALRDLTHRECSSATNAVSAASFAVRPQTEHRRAPCAQRGRATLEPRLRPARRLACAPASAQRTLRTIANAHNGPTSDISPPTSPPAPSPSRTRPSAHRPACCPGCAG